MRLIVADIKDDKSCVVEETDCTVEGDRMSPRPILDLVLDPPPVRPAGVGEYRDLGVPLGSMRWMRIHFPANQVRPVHYTNTIDCHTVIDGWIELLLDDGPHRLMPGDMAIVKGVDHGWHIGPDGCTISTILLGTPGPE
jgi:quercetin dioxygenase-like cupin family protein